MNKKTLIAMVLVFVAVAPVGAAEVDKTEMVAASDTAREPVDCFYDQNRYMPECKK